MVSDKYQKVRDHTKNFFQESTGKFTVISDYKQELGKGLEYKILKQAGLK